MRDLFSNIFTNLSIEIVDDKPKTKSNVGDDVNVPDFNNVVYDTHISNLVNGYRVHATKLMVLDEVSVTYAYNHLMKHEGRVNNPNYVRIIEIQKDDAPLFEVNLYRTISGVSIAVSNNGGVVVKRYRLSLEQILEMYRLILNEPELFYETTRFGSALCLYVHNLNLAGNDCI
jgi:hypothetical protein